MGEGSNWTRAPVTRSRQCFALEPTAEVASSRRNSASMSSCVARVRSFLRSRRSGGYFADPGHGRCVEGDRRGAASAARASTGTNSRSPPDEVPLRPGCCAERTCCAVCRTTSAGDRARGGRHAAARGAELRLLYENPPTALWVAIAPAPFGAKVFTCLVRAARQPGISHGHVFKISCSPA
jgi:hypothetical protein